MGSLPADFDATIYKSLHADLHHMTDTQAAYHYKISGSNEKRRYTINYKLYPTLFHKYLLNIRSPMNPVRYDIVKTHTIKKSNICHVHFDVIEDFSRYDSYIANISKHFDVIITYCTGCIETIITSPKEFERHMTTSFIHIKKIGYDIGAKICLLDYLAKNSIKYNYILFLHSNIDIYHWDSLVKNTNRLNIINCLLTMNNNNILGIFPDKMFYDYNGYTNIINEYISNESYFVDILSYLGCKNANLRIFASGNCMILSRTVIDFVFGVNLPRFYNLLNDDTSFDLNWVKIYYPNLSSLSDVEIYDTFRKNKLFGNNNVVKSNPCCDGMIEHVFERIWINIIDHFNGRILVLNPDNIITRYDIKINAIYFPQFHECEENNTFWGEGFTEWTLLKPFIDNYDIEGKPVRTLKPHDDIGYYDLNDVNTMKKQIDIANKHGINGFVIYHYWFNTTKKVLYKPLEYFLSPNITFPFCISWANECWSRRWDGSNEELLIKQEYGDVCDWIAHITYLIQFFLRPNYMRNQFNECIMYIYNFPHIESVFVNMINVWKVELHKFDLKLKLISTYNSFQRGTQDQSLTKFYFEPMNSVHTTHYRETNRSLFIPKDRFDYTQYAISNPNIVEYFNNNPDEIYQYYSKESWSVSYEYIRNNYLNNYFHHEHFGLPLYWNNYIRRKNKKFLQIQHFSIANMQRLLTILICRIVLRYSNMFIPQSYNEITFENFININAWNEWNEQAVLEPNTEYGYELLEAIKELITDC
jgi:hypothetical protein